MLTYFSLSSCSTCHLMLVIKVPSRGYWPGQWPELLQLLQRTHLTSSGQDSLYSRRKDLRENTSISTKYIVYMYRTDNLLLMYNVCVDDFGFCYANIMILLSLYRMHFLKLIIIRLFLSLSLSLSLCLCLSLLETFVIPLK